jgi:hypothetical protein
LTVHTVTKVLVVFAAVLCVLLAALTMAYSINAERITADYRAQVNAKQAAEEGARAQIAAAGAESTQKEKTIAELQQKLTTISNQVQSLESELAQKRLEVNTSKLAADDKNAQLNQLATTSQTQAKLIDSYRGEVTKLRDNELAFRKKETELVDHINDLESQREVQDGSIRALQEQLAEMRRTVDSGGTAVSGGGAAPSGPYTPSIPISGKVLQVATSKANGKPYATINVGANNQVKENMKLAISRNGQFLGNLVVTKTDLQWAVGEINTLGQKVDIREGDSVGTLVSR